MPRIPAEALAAKRREILAGARRAFAQHGYEGATVRILEAETGVSRGAIFHHFPDKDALFIALAEEDAEEMIATVRRGGLIQVMRELPARDAGWLGVQLEVSRRLRTDAEFRTRWQHHLDRIAEAATERLHRGADAGTIRTDIPVPVLVAYLQLMLDGMVAQLAAGLPASRVGQVLDLAEQSVRRQPAPAALIKQ